MEIEVLQSLTGNIGELLQKITAENPGKDKIDGYLKEYEPETHEVITDKAKRPDKIVTTDNSTKSVPVARLAIPMQKKIVQLSSAFLCANPVQIRATPADELQKGLLEMVQKAWDDAKLDYKTLDLAEKMMSQTEVAEIWYLDDAGENYWAGTVNEGCKFKLRVRVLAASLGDTLLPSFNAAGDMIAFGRQYNVVTADGTEKHFDLYTDTQIFQSVNKGSDWETLTLKNAIGKIPVIYYKQDKPEWQDVQTLINRLEISLSKHSDTNDYFGSPIVKVSGDVKGFSSKGEDGKVLQLNKGADANYLTWNQSPESVKLEQENLRSFVYDMTDTPDISFQQMKGLGTYSGFAIKMLFTSAHLKAARKEGIFGEGIQRRLNLIKEAMVRVINIKLEKAAVLNMKPSFKYFLPEDIKEEVETLVDAFSGGILSRETAVSLNPLVENAEEELDLIDANINTSSSLDDNMNDPDQA